MDVVPCKLRFSDGCIMDMRRLHDDLATALRYAYATIKRPLRDVCAPVAPRFVRQLHKGQYRSHDGCAPVMHATYTIIT